MNSSARQTFANHVRNAMRRKTSIIAITEARDAETIKAAVKAALMDRPTEI